MKIRIHLKIFFRSGSSLGIHFGSQTAPRRCAVDPSMVSRSFGSSGSCSGSLGTALRALGAALGILGTALGAMGPALGTLGAELGALGIAPGALGIALRTLGAALGILGIAQGNLRTALGSLGTALGALGSALRALRAAWGLWELLWELWNWCGSSRSCSGILRSWFNSFGNCSGSSGSFGNCSGAHFKQYHVCSLRGSDIQDGSKTPGDAFSRRLKSLQPLSERLPSGLNDTPRSLGSFQNPICPKQKLEIQNLNAPIPKSHHPKSTIPNSS